MPGPQITVVGIGADGWPGLPLTTRHRVERAPVVVGSERQLGLLPEVPGQVRRAWGHPLALTLLDDLAAELGEPLLVLASGDPMLAGIGATLVRHYGAEAVEVVPAVSSVALAAARLGWSTGSFELVRVTGEDVAAVRRHLAPGARVLLLSADAATPALLAADLVALGWGASALVVLADLGAPHETRLETTAGELAAARPAVPRLNLVALTCAGPGTGSWASGLPDEAFEHDGQLTKRDLRAAALARLRPQPGQLLWDVGAGAGSVGIEWLRAHPRCRALAVEQDAARAQRIALNARHLGVPELRVVEGRAPEALGDLPAPDAVFVGGGATEPGLLERCREVLASGGRLVVHGVTLETERLLGRAYAGLGGELTRHAVEHAAPLGSFTGWTPARAVTQWAWEKP